MRCNGLKEGSENYLPFCILLIISLIICTEVLEIQFFETELEGGKRMGVIMMRRIENLVLCLSFTFSLSASSFRFALCSNSLAI
jgi:hypothetical protein